MLIDAAVVKDVLEGRVVVGSVGRASAGVVKAICQAGKLCAFRSGNKHKM